MALEPLYRRNEDGTFTEVPQDEPHPWSPFTPHDATEPSPEKDSEETFTHYVHLHDGRVLKHNMAAKSPYFDGPNFIEGEIDDDGTDGRTISQVIGVYSK